MPESPLIIGWSSIGESAWRLLADQSTFARHISEERHCWPLVCLLVSYVIAGGLIHGVALGARGGFKQLAGSAIKTPLVPLAALAVTFPLLYIVGITMGSALSFSQTFALALIPLALAALLIASAAPALLFFGMTSDYHFAKLLNVFAFGIAAFYGMIVLHRSMNHMPSLTSTSVRTVFQLWTLIYGFTGAQMAWVMRPLLGDPSLPFEWIRQGPSRLSFYSAVFLSLLQILSKRPDSSGQRSWEESGRNTEEARPIR